MPSDWIPIPCVADVIATHWPETKKNEVGQSTTARHEFAKRMRVIQTELIYCHYTEMDERTRDRADSTLAWLEGMG